MASDKDYLEFVLEQLSSLDEISSRYMMGEYIIYYRGKIIGGIYDNRFLIKPTKSAERLISDVHYAIPYKGAKEMIEVEDIENREFICNLINEMYDELPEPKKKK